MTAQIDVHRVALPADRDRLVEFLCNDDWPFHGTPSMSAADVDEMQFVTDDVDSYWIEREGRQVGLVRLLDLGDIGTGTPLLDVRVAAAHRGRGIGTLATRWAVDHLFRSYPELHRIEATTRADNAAMQAVLRAAGFELEGRLRQAWWTARGTWSDTLVYGMLRAEWRGSAPQP